MKPIHINPEEAARAHQVLGAHRSVGMHFDTFALGDEAAGQAPKDLRKATAKLGVDDERFWVLDFGEGRDVPPR
jgi:L-ascorbate metabolism protein UlaG (beta-lactamase superfamily)